MRIIDTYIGIKPFAVLVDDSSNLRELVAKARELKDLPFQEKLAGVKQLALDAMINAYEQMIFFGKKAEGLEEVTTSGSDDKVGNSNYKTARKQHERFRDIVSQKHPLSHALQQEAGCCRYQGALFFVLGYEASLGNQHFVQVAPVNSKANTVFNEIFYDGQNHKVSVFIDSLRDKSLDYSRQNPRILEQAFETFPGLNFYSYHRAPSGLVIVENQNRHATILGK